MNVLITGLGSIAAKHISALRAIDPQVGIHALRSRPDSKPHEGVNDLHTLDGCGIGFDFAIISNPTSMHATTISRLLELRIPLFIEKPLFESVEHEAVLGEIERAGVPTYVACNLRHLDSLKFLHDYIKSHPGRRVNEVNVYCGSYLPGWRPGTDWRQCYSAREELGGGANLDLIHDIDYTCWIFGMPQQTRGVCRSVSGLCIGAVDYANYTLLYPGFTASVVLNYYRRDYRRRMEVLFDDDTWTLDVASNCITDMSGATVYQGVNTIIDTYTDQLRYFIDTVRKGAVVDNDARSAYEILKICLDYERLD